MCGEGTVDLVCLGRGIEDLREVVPDFEGVVVDEGSAAAAAAAASSLTILFLIVSSRFSSIHTA